jgi:hypothetical protein
MIQTYNISCIFENTNKILLEFYFQNSLANLKIICCFCCPIVNSAVAETKLINITYR